MKNEMKLNNKGFSLVELIVVIAIMAILVGVLAPSVLGQIDKAKQSKDKQTIETVVTAVATAYADQTITSGKPTASASISAVTFTPSTNTAYSGTGVPTEFNEAIQQIVGYTSVALESNQFSSATVAINLDTTTGKVTATAVNGGTTIFTVTR